MANRPHPLAFTLYSRTDPVEFRPLRKEDDRSRFSCNNSEIDSFFRQFAG